MKRLFAAFVLTPAEQRLVVFVVVLLVAFAWLKHRRELNFEAAITPAPNVE